MPQWQDQGIVLNARPFGESDQLLHLFTLEHGTVAGLVKNGQSKRIRSLCQAGTQVTADWHARLETHLGSFRLEAVSSPAPTILLEKGRLSCMSSALALIRAVMAEYEAHPNAYHDLCALLVALDSPLWAETYIKWEIALLNEIGFGLNLSSCAATGVLDDLCYVSPKSGRAVSREAGEPYHDRLLALPSFLIEGGEAIAPLDLDLGLRMSGYFLIKGPFAQIHQGIPPARQRLQDFFSSLSSKD